MNMEDWKNDILNSTKGVKRAQPPADGFIKIQQKLSEQRMDKVRPESSSWLKVAAVAALVLCANAWAITTYFSSENSASSDQQGYPQIVSNYNLYGNE